MARMPFVDEVRMIVRPPGIAEEGDFAVMVDEAGRYASWALYVELATRIPSKALAPSGLRPDTVKGSLAELVDSVRGVLRDSGPDAGSEPDTVGGLAIRMLEEDLIPFVGRFGPYSGFGGGEVGSFWKEADGVRERLREWTEVFRRLATARP